MSNGLPKKRVAVIAIHGVADQKPEDTAKTVADLLARNSHCDAFQQSPLRISVDRVPVHGPLGETEEFKKRASSLSKSALQQLTRTPAFAWNRTPRTVEPPAQAASPPDTAHEYMHEQLSGYLVVQEQDATYETVRLVSQGKAGADGDDTEVHVFEMYWADLSRFAGSGYQIFVELYQLLFYLCGLGRKMIKFAQREDRLGGWWTAFTWCQSAAERLLVLGVPTLNLYLLALASVTVPLWLGYGHVEIAARVLAAVVAGGACTYGVFRWQLRRPGTPGSWFVLLALPVAASWAMAVVVASVSALTWLLAVWGLIAGGAVLWLLFQYQQRQPGAFSFGVGAGILYVGLYGVEIVWPAAAVGNDLTRPIDGMMHAMEWMMAPLVAMWALLVLAALLATITSTIALFRVRRQPQVWERARRAAWTGNLTLVLPALLVLMLNLSLWQAVVVTLLPAGPEGQKETDMMQVLKIAMISVFAAAPFSSPAASPDPATPTSAPSPMPSPSPAATPSHWQMLWQGKHTPVAGICVKSSDAAGAARELIDDQAPQGYGWICIVFFGAVLWMAWSILPAVGTEGTPPGDEVRTSIWQGETLSLAFKRMRWSGEIVRFLVVVALPAAMVRSCWEIYHPGSVVKFYALGKEAALWAGATVMVGVLASRGWFRFLAFGLRSALDIALDVTNWLRLFPRHENPRARICARFYSLLRYICEWRDSRDGGGYDALIIIAHSQGTVIAADLLRFLHEEAGRGSDLKPSRLGAPDFPAFLFTMGCPLRQLYSLRFPQLYDWARHDSAASTDWPGQKPQPATLGLQGWTNAYRSGDYVGRHVWWPEQWPATWDPTVTKNNPELGIKEFCIGAGAHLNYWDSHGDRIGEELNRLIQEAISRQNS